MNSPFTLSRLCVLVVSVGSLLLTGCLAIDSAAPSIDSFGATGTMSGAIHGGQFPIYNATVNLYAAGTTGYGAGATLLATTTTDKNGVFQFTKLATGTVGSGASWSCPTSDPDPQIYIMAVGGNTQGTGTTTTNNSAAALMTAIGSCSTISTSTQVQVNELTSAATIFALAQYINPGSGPGTAMIGTKGGNTSSNTPEGAIGLNNAVAGIANLVNIAAGTAVSANTYKGTNTSVTNVTVTATPETAKLVTIANIIAACINTTSSSSSLCGDLFASASPPPSASVTSQPSAPFVTAQDTIQAAYYMAVNPTSAGTFTSCSSGATTKMACLFNLPTSTAPFQTGLTSQPTDWTLSVSYSAYIAGSATPLSSGGHSTTISPYTCGTTGHYFLYGAEKSAVDAYGNLWFVNGIGHTDNMGAISPIGKPLFCANLINPTTPYSAGLTIDTAGNIWVSMVGSAGGTQIYEVSAPGAVPAAAAITSSFTSAYPVDSIVADGFGNIFYSTYPNSSNMNVYEIPSGSTSATLVGSSIASAESASTNIASAVDSVGRVYFASNTATGSNGSLVEVTPPSASISSYSVSGGSITFTTTNNNTFTAGQKVILSGLTTTDGLTLDQQQLTLTAATPTAFTAATTLSNISSTPDEGVAVIVGAGASSYSIVTNYFGTPTYGAVLDNNNYYYGGITCCGSSGPNETLIKATISPVGTAVTTQAGNYTFSAQNIGGLTGLRSAALDGADNLWFTNQFASNDGGSAESPSSGTGIWSIGEVSTAGTGSTATFTALSPPPTGLTGGDTCTNSTGCPAGGGFQKSALNGLTFGLSLDPSGNVWAPNFASPADVPVGGYGNANIVELLGVAVPVVTPLSIGAKNGALGTKP